MLKLYFLKVWIKSLEKGIQTSKKFSTAAWVLIAFLSLIISLISYDNLTARRLDSVSPELKEFYKPDSAEMERKFPNYKVEVISGLRTCEQQNEFYRQGETPAKCRQSYHQPGLAIDIASLKNGKPFLNNYNFWSENAKVIQKYGMESGSSWRKRDFAHIQVPRNVYLLSQAGNDFKRGGFGEVFVNAETLMPGKKHGFTEKTFGYASKNKKSLLIKKYKNNLQTNAPKIFLNSIKTAEKNNKSKITVGRLKNNFSGNYQFVATNWRLSDHKKNDFLYKNQAPVDLDTIRNSKPDNLPDIFSLNSSLLFGSSASHPFLNLMYSLKLSLDELKKYLVNPFKPYVINANDKSPAPWNWQFWLLLFNGIMNAVASISAMILAWISNNRAKAEFLLKRAKDERDKLELELKIKEMELQIMKMQKELEIKSPMIVLKT